MGLNRIAKISYGQLCLREENLNFDNNYLETVNFHNKYPVYPINNVSTETLTIGRMIPSGTNSPPGEVSSQGVLLVDY